MTARTKGKAPVSSEIPAKTGASSSKPRPTRSNAPDAASSSHARQRSVEEVDEVTPHVYPELGEKQHGRRLDETSDQTAAALAAGQEPRSALEHYEKAVEKESEGRLGDSLSLYRKAFKVSPCQNLVDVEDSDKYSSMIESTRFTKRSTFHRRTSNHYPSLR